jgi:hypothetical protein
VSVRVTVAPTSFSTFRSAGAITFLNKPLHRTVMVTHSHIFGIVVVHSMGKS